MSKEGYGFVRDIDGKKKVDLLSQLECNQCKERAVNVMIGDDAEVYIKCHSCEGCISVNEIKSMIEELPNGEIGDVFYMGRNSGQ